MNKALIVAVALIAGSGFALGQQASSGEAPLSRVQFRTGNSIDCQVESATDKELTINVGGKRFHVLKDDVVSIEPLKAPSVPERSKGVLAFLAPSSEVKSPPLDPGVRAEVDRMLSQLPEVTAAEKDQLTKELSLRSGIGPYLASQLERCVDDAVPYVARAIWDLQEAESYPYVLACLGSDRAPVVCAGLALSARWESKDSVLNIQPFLSDSRPSVRAGAIDALRLLVDERSLPIIAQHLESKDAVVRATAIKACLDLGRRQKRMDLVVGYLKDAIARAQGGVLEDLIEAAGRTGSPELVDPMIRCLREDDPAVRIGAIAGLVQNRSTAASQALAQRLLVDDSVAVRLHLVRGAAALKSMDAVGPLIETLRDRNEALVEAARRALEDITKVDQGDRYEAWASWWEQSRGR